MSDVLANILRSKCEELGRIRKQHSEESLASLARAQSTPRGFAAALRAQAGKGPAVIAEIKRASPSRGRIWPKPDFDVGAIAREYAAAGASCLSVLTDGPFFEGHADYLPAARAATALPALRKDFLIDPIQILESRALGADCVLLIAAALSDMHLRELRSQAKTLGMDVLIEIHSREELERMLRLGLQPGDLLGINNRDLRSFVTRLEQTLELLPLLPAGTEVITESGIHTPADVARMMDAGVHRFLVGESLMREGAPGAALAKLMARPI
jgi:indole-3-glycerol phosphate synthase